MAQSYPIWIDVSGDNYKQSKSFGSRDSVTMDIKVGSSKTYSMGSEPILSCLFML